MSKNNSRGAAQTVARSMSSTRSNGPVNHPRRIKKSGPATKSQPLVLPTLRDAAPPGYKEIIAGDGRVTSVVRTEHARSSNSGGSNGRTENFRSTGNR